MSQKWIQWLAKAFTNSFLSLDNVIWDFIIGLPVNYGYKAILIIVD